MMRVVSKPTHLWSVLILTLSSLFSWSLVCAQVPLGTFRGQSDIGSVLHPGSARFDAVGGVYTVSGSGVNMWAGHDSTLPLASTSTLIPTAPEMACNNDHGLSPDGAMLAISDQGSDGRSRIFVLPSIGGTPRQITPDGPSSWHGWSPDGTATAFTGLRAGELDIYTIPVTGGAETRLTTSPGLDDGPEYSPDGRWIYFNSVRSEHMQIWRMHPDGSSQEQVLTEDRNDWFPHLSPDGKLMAWVSFPPGVQGHPANQEGVEVRMMSLADGRVTMLAKLFGGQGTLNVASWSPDSSMVAFVSYEMLPPQ